LPLKRTGEAAGALTAVTIKTPSRPFSTGEAQWAMMKSAASDAVSETL
jgi:hypothetical protein